MTEVHHGLEGVVAFESEIAEPDKEGSALRYRGVDIEEIVGLGDLGLERDHALEPVVHLGHVDPPSRGRPGGRTHRILPRSAV